MREILFRGKREDNGEWIEGYLFSTVNHTYIVYTDQYDDDLFFSPKNIFIAVDPETVGQYTGLTDKNGKKIFEGDVVKYTSELNRTYTCTVLYHEKNAIFNLYFLETKGCIGNFVICSGNKCEVIGNIHDNPELLKGGENNETPH